MAGPALTTGSAAEPGSLLPQCSRYTTGPANLASVTTEPSAARNRVTTTRGAGGFGAGEAGGLLAGTLEPVTEESTSAAGRPGWAGDEHAAAVSAAATAATAAARRARRPRRGLTGIGTATAAGRR